MSEQLATETTLVLRRVFNASRERVFRAWTDPGALRRWYGISDDWETPSVQVDLRVGGRYRIEMRPPGHAPFVETGVYAEVDAPARLVYTCALEAAPGAEAGHDETLVTVDFVDLGDGRTEVVVVQEGFADRRQRDIHAGGWPRFLDRLERVELS